MPLPVINNVFQATLVWSSSSAQRAATNTMYFLDNVGTQTAIDLANEIDAAVTAGMWDLLGGTATKVDQVETKELTSPEPAPYIKTVSGAKWGAGSTGDPVLQGAAVVSIKTALAGKSFRGRLYLPFVAEASQTAGVLNTTSVATMQTAWTTFRAAMITSGWDLGVVSPTLGSFEAATQLIIRPYLKTQRRRARR